MNSQETSAGTLQCPPREQCTSAVPKLKLKHISEVNKLTLTEREDPDFEFKYIDIGAVNSLGEIGDCEVLRFEDAPSRARRVVTSGDTVVSTVRTYLRSIARVGESDRPQVASTGFAVLSPRKGIDSHYLSWALRSPQFVESVVANSEGVSYPAIAPSKLVSLTVPVPCLNRQESIARFLESECGRIDTLVLKKRKVIRSLKERRDALIFHCIAKGLTAGVPLKDSGYEAIGQIPKHWRMIPLMRLTQQARPIMYGIVLPGSPVADGRLLVKGGDVKPGRLSPSSLGRVAHEIELPYARARLSYGDLVYAIRGSIGDVELVPPDLDGSNITQDVARVAPSSKISPVWLKYALRSSGVFQQLEARALGATIKGINIRDLKRAMIPVPPRAEQDQIAQSLDQRVAIIDGLVWRSEAVVKLLLERRMRIIEDAVSGRINPEAD